jgi:protein-S-isoprenylcysteine O-methyltransferase Ste14
MTSGRFISLCWIVFFLYWIVAAFFVKRTVERGRWWPRVIVAVALLLLARRLTPREIGVGLGGGTVLWRYSRTVGIAADLLTAAGLAVTLWARAVLAGNWSAVVALKEGHELIERGPYRYARHPIYSGLLVMVLGVVVFDGRLRGVIAFGLILFGLWFKSHLEERLLTKHFPEAYPAYKRRVHALIPFVL